MFIIFYILVVCILILIALLLYLSPGKMKPYVDNNRNVLKGSISEKIHVNINGLKQGMIIKSTDITKL